MPEQESRAHRIDDKTNGMKPSTKVQQYFEIPKDKLEKDNRW